MDAWVVLAVMMMVAFFGALLAIAAGAAFGVVLLARHLVHESAELLGLHGSDEPDVAEPPKSPLHV